MALGAAGIYRRMELSHNEDLDSIFQHCSSCASLLLGFHIGQETSITQGEEGSSANSGLPHQRSQKAATEWEFEENSIFRLSRLDEAEVYFSMRKQAGRQPSRVEWRCMCSSIWKELDRSTGRRYGLVQGRCTSVSVAWRGCALYVCIYFFRAIYIPS
jgi:hypothetical protein